MDPRLSQAKLRDILSGVPRRSYLLAAAGNFFLGIGLYGLLVPNERLLKALFDVNENAILLLVLGVVLSLPLYINVAKQALLHRDRLEDP